MFRVSTSPRPNWEQQAEALGFKFHSLYGDTYWDESAYYRFSLQQIEQEIENPTAEIHQMCLQLVDKAVNSEEMMTRLKIPERYWDYIRRSWIENDPYLYGRMDFSYDGRSPVKFYEYNADTPTSLYESAYFQWLWLEDMIREKRLPAESDQFNIIQEMLIEALVVLRKRCVGDQPLYFSCCKDTEEDFGTVAYFRDCAVQAGMNTGFVYVEDIGLSPDRQFTDLKDMTIPALFKLYPWENLFEEGFGPDIEGSETLFIEPPWKAILSNKAMLPLLWREYRGHPNLLPSYFEDEKIGDDLGSHYVKKPVFSREGANISVFDNETLSEFVDGPYDDSGYILQKFHALPKFDGNYTLIGSWIVGDQPAGIGIREDNFLITKDSSRFLPHIIMD
ncbi:MAG: glutathionylspermidine synthase family protein [Endozoicomonas sp.]